MSSAGSGLLPPRNQRVGSVFGEIMEGPRWRRKLHAFIEAKVG
eukprot:COSAG05_NODE_500_length_9234_cov_107.281664_14_plen_43_part_00